MVVMPWMAVSRGCFRKNGEVALLVAGDMERLVVASGTEDGPKCAVIGAVYIIMQGGLVSLIW